MTAAVFGSFFFSAHLQGFFSFTDSRRYRVYLLVYGLVSFAFLCVVSSRFWDEVENNVPSLLSRKKLPLSLAKFSVRQT